MSVPARGHELAFQRGLRPNPQGVICPAIDSDHRSDAREVIYRFRKLSPNGQQAVIEFLKQL